MLWEKRDDSYTYNRLAVETAPMQYAEYIKAFENTFNFLAVLLQLTQSMANDKEWSKKQARSPEKSIF